MKSIVVWLWTDVRFHAARGREFLASHVNACQEMIERVMPEKHRFICVSDTPKGLSAKVEWHKTPPEAAALSNLRSPEGERFPSCYRRLYNFSEGAKAFGDERIMCLDVDFVAVRDIAPLWDLMPQDFVGWRPYRDWGRQLRYGGGIYLIKPGARSHVWTEFYGQMSILKARHAGYRGSDQAWISYKLGPHEAHWDKKAGIYSVRDMGPTLDVPKDARIVQFNGNMKPWHYIGRTFGPGAWVSRHWKWSREPVRVPAKQPKVLT